MIDPKQSYQSVISSEHHLLDLHIRETLKYKDLIFLFVKRDFTALYKQTILGPMWAIIQPLLTTVVFTVIFGNLARLTTSDADGAYIIPGFLFYMAGNVCWTYFANTLQDTSDTFLRNRNVMGKVYFPRMVSPIATAISNLIAFGIQLVMLFTFWAYYLIRGGTSIQVTPMLFMLPVLILQLMLLAMGTGIIISSVTTKYRDLKYLVGFGIQLWQFASPIAYGLQLVPERFRGLYLLNPITPIITTFRKAVFGFGYFDIQYYLLGWGITLTVFIIGMVFFNRIERNFMDTI